MSLPNALAPMLCTAARSAPDGDDWCHEIKHDGFRLLCRKEGGEVRLFTRNGHDWTHRLGSVAEEAGHLPFTSGWLDGELVVYAEDGRTDFPALQRQLGRGSGRQLTFQAWDLMYLDGRSLLEEPLLERKELLQRLMANAPACLRYTEHILGQGPALFERVSELGLEGIVSKRTESRYRPGARSPDWLKIKVWWVYDLLLVGVDLDESGEAAKALVMARQREPDGALVYAGRVTIGVPRMRELLQPLQERRSPELLRGMSGAGRLWLPEPIPAKVRDIPLKQGELLRHAQLLR